MAVLIFKQGNSESSSLSYAEPLFHTDSNTLLISGSMSEYTNTEVTPNIASGSLSRVALIDYINTGSFITTADISGSNLFLHGNATIRGNITMGGSGLDFGDSAADNIVFKADISSSVIPNDNGKFDLGSDSQRWKSLYQSGALDVQGGPINLHSNTYISASAGTFLDVDVTGAITVNGESTTAISSSGALSLNSETQINIGTTTDKPIDIDSSTLDIDASGAITIDGTSTLSIDVDGATNINTSVGGIEINSEAGSLTLDGHTGVDIDASNSGKVTIDGADGIDIGVAVDKPIDIDSTTLDIDASGAITIDGTSTVSIDGAGATNLTTSTGNITVDSAAGNLILDGHTGVDIDASNSGKVAIDGAGGIDIGVAADVAIDIDSSTLDIDASGAITINGESSTHISSSGALTLDSQTQINIGTTTDKPIDIDATTLDIDASDDITIDTTDTSQGISIGTATSGVPVKIGHTTSETTINDNLTVTGNFTVNGTTTYVSSSNVTIGDRIIELNYLGTSGDAGLYVGDVDGTGTSGSLLWDASADQWVAGQKGLEHKILRQNGDSVISGSGVDNQITLFSSTHGIDSSTNLTYNGQILDVVGAVSASTSGSFLNALVDKDITAGSGSFGKVDVTNTLTVGGDATFTTDTFTIQSANDGDPLVKLKTTHDGVNGPRMWFQKDGTSPATDDEVGAMYFISEDSGNNLTTYGSIRVNIGNVTDTDEAGRMELVVVSSDGTTATTRPGIRIEGHPTSDYVDVALGAGASSTTRVSGSMTVAGDITITGRAVISNGLTGSIGATNGIFSGSSQVDHDATTNFVANEHINHTSVTLTAGDGLTGGGDISSNRTFAVNPDDTTIEIDSDAIRLKDGGITNAKINAAAQIAHTKLNLSGSNLVSGSSQVFLGSTVISGSGGTWNATAAMVTGSLYEEKWTTGDGTDSTSKTTGALIVSGGLGILNTISAGGDVIAYASSDERLKDNIKPIDGALNKVSKISGNTFDWNEQKQNIYKGRDYGVIAQEIEAVMPELVDTRDNGYLAVKYDKIVPLLIEAIKELKQEIEELKSK